jgi:hypothetical protein
MKSGLIPTSTSPGRRSTFNGSYAVIRGLYSARSSGNGSRSQRTITDLSPNTTYHCQARVRSSDATASIGVSNYGGSPVTVGTTQAGWTSLTFTFKTGANNTTADVWCGVTSGAGDGYFDNFNVY